MIPYQPRWVKGRAMTDGQRDAQVRYEAIRDVLRRSSTSVGRVLDFGAYGGYFSFRLAEDFGCEVVAVDDCSELQRCLDANQNPLVEGITKQLTVDEVKELGDFDVVLALSVLHHVPEWVEMLQTLQRQCRAWFFVETPEPDEELSYRKTSFSDLRTAVENLGGETIAKVPGYNDQFQRELKAVIQF